MPRKPRPTKQIVAFKVEPELAALLDAMPNKSEFIRSAVQRQLATACPLCRGTGLAPIGVGDELTKLVQQHPLCVCAGCGVKEPRPCHSPGHCEDDHLRIDAFERWGVFYCEACAAQLSFCTDCHKPLGKLGGKKKATVCEQCKAA